MSAQLEQHAQNLCHRYNQWTINLAFTELDRGTIDLRSGEYQKVTFQEIGNLLRYCPIDTKKTNEDPTSCLFLHQSVTDFVVAKQLIEELKTAATGALSPTALINIHSIVNKEAVGGFIIQMGNEYRDGFDELLVDIVKQSRSRDDMTQASANAITLLNQMEYSFAIL